MTPARFFQRAKHFGERIANGAKRFPKVRKNFGWKIAVHTFRDGLVPPGKSPRYISAVEEYVDREMADLAAAYQTPEKLEANAADTHISGKLPIWVCWWQGEDQMPEIVRMCHQRLRQVIPEDRVVLHVITRDNYLDYADIPAHIVEKFRQGIVTMATMSDVLRFQLLAKYGGYWLDATVFFSGAIPEEYFSKDFYCQRMAKDPEKVKREACKGNWCGFSMKGLADCVVFRYMNDAFSLWWEKHDDIVDYVLIDYLLWTGYRKIPAIREIIDTVPDNNEDIFELYTVLNQPYSDELYQQMTARNVMHKLTYKMDLRKETESGEQTMYGWLLDRVREGGRGL